MDENYDRLWKFRTIFDELSDSYAKYYSPTLCNSKGYRPMYNTAVYFGKDRKHANVTGLTASIKRCGTQTISVSVLCDDLHTKTINCCGTVRP
jgi:hypothetical protein